MTRDRLKYAACQSMGILEGMPDYRRAQLAMDCALDSFPVPIHVVAEAAHYTADLSKWKKQFRKQRERETKALRRATREKMVAAIQADPAAYGFGPVTIWIVGILIQALIGRVVEWLMAKRYEDVSGDWEIQQACGRAEP